MALLIEIEIYFFLFLKTFKFDWKTFQTPGVLQLCAPTHICQREKQSFGCSSWIYRKTESIFQMSSEEHRQKHPWNREAIFWRFSAEYCQTENIVQTFHRNIAQKKPFFYRIPSLTYTHMFRSPQFLQNKKFNVDKGSWPSTPVLSIFGFMYINSSLRHLSISHRWLWLWSCSCTFSATSIIYLLHIIY